MSVRKRGERWVAKVYDPTCQGNQRWLGSYDSEEVARAVEALGISPGVRLTWTLASKCEDACRNCGNPAEHLHHIVPRALGRGIDRINDPHVNGLPLCRPCHWGWHGGRVVIAPAIMHTEEQAFVLDVMGDRWFARVYGSPTIPPSGLNDALLEELVALRVQLRRLRGGAAGELVDADESARWREQRDRALARCEVLSRALSDVHRETARIAEAALRDAPEDEKLSPIRGALPLTGGPR